MIQYGDLPVINAREEQTDGPRDFPASLWQSTAHIRDMSGTGRKRRCHCCETLVEVYVCKPGSPLAWCLRCF